MKNIKLYIPIIMAAAFFSCQPQEQAQYLSLSMTSWSFASGQSDTVDVTVLSSDPDWTVQGGPEWLYVSKADDGTLKMVAMANEGADGREALVVVECGNGLSAELEVNQFGTSFTGVMEDFVEMHAEGALSKSGEWFCGVEVFGYDDDGVYARYRPVIINLETGDREKYKETTYEKCLAISDDGRTIILGNEGNMEFAVMVDGEFIEMPLPEGYRNPAYQNMSADGSVIIGFAQLVDDNWNPYRPIAWRNGDAEILEVPEVNATGQSLGMGVMARACSSDGSVIYGSEWDYNSTVYWKDGQMHYPGLEYAEVVSDWGDCSRPIIMGERFNLSHDGRYLVQMYLTSDPSGNKSYSAAYVDTETGELKIFDSGVSPITVRNDGLAFCGNSNFQMTGGMVMNLNTGEAVSSSEWFKSEYGINIANTFIVQQVGENGNMAGVRAIITGLGITYRPFYIVPE